MLRNFFFLQPDEKEVKIPRNFFPSVQQSRISHTRWKSRSRGGTSSCGSWRITFFRFSRFILNVHLRGIFILVLLLFLPVALLLFCNWLRFQFVYLLSNFYKKIRLKNSKLLCRGLPLRRINFRYGFVHSACVGLPSVIRQLHQLCKSTRYGVRTIFNFYVLYTTPLSPEIKSRKWIRPPITGRHWAEFNRDWNKNSSYFYIGIFWSDR